MDWKNKLECPYCDREIICRNLDEGVIVTCEGCQRSSIMHADYMMNAGMIYWLLAMEPEEISV